MDLVQALRPACRFLGSPPLIPRVREYTVMAPMPRLAAKQHKKHIQMLEHISFPAWPRITLPCTARYELPYHDPTTHYILPALVRIY